MAKMPRLNKMPRRKEYSFRREVSIPAGFGPGSVASAGGKVRLPNRVAWSGQGEFDLDDPHDRQHAYEIVLAEGTDDDVRTYVDWHGLLDAWGDMFVAPHVTDAWSRHMRSLEPDRPRYASSSRFADALRADGLSVVAELPPGPVDPRAAERCRAGGASGIAIAPISYWKPAGRSPEADDSLDGVHEATRCGLPILRTGNVDSIHDARLTRMLALQSTLVSLDRVAATQALAIRDTAWGEGTGFAVEVRDEDQIDIAAAISASVVVVNGDDPDRMLSLGPDVAGLAEHVVTAAKVPSTGPARARFGDIADAGYDAALVQLDPGEDPVAVLGSLADQIR
ncbi:hypothetical protein [Candidatus Poriferisodalis sp.]|uniref:hypothetical protein n=1 Tax=Candidatus Poriferisodalis sp. TaxID=3101277 RepID=UPI003B520F6D